MMKYLRKIIFCCLCFGMFFGITKAETFYEGDYISGEYINKVIDGKTYYMTLQYIKDNSGNIVYCLEPFVKFVDGKSYTEYTGDLVGYDKLTNEQKRKISLIIYYGYGYGDRTDSKWYVVTQYLVWKTVDSNANIYFTKTLNGKKIDKYLDEQNIILNDVVWHDIVPEFVGNYVVDYGDNISFNGLNRDYIIEGINYYYEYDTNGYLTIKDVRDSSSFSVKKVSNYYSGDVVIYDSVNSQDVIRPGNVINNSMEMSIDVRKGDITLDIRDDDTVYTVESDFSDTCYDLYKDNEIISSVCTDDQPIIYKTDYLKYGEYVIKQRSVGKGYIKDMNEYKVIIDENNKNPEIVLYNKLLRNNIEINKYYCIDNNCQYEEDAHFEVYDKNNKLVDTIITDNMGYGKSLLGYGSYNIKQVKGKENYTLNEEYWEKIVDEESSHYRILYDHYIEEEKEEEVLGEIEVIPEIVDIPDTKVDGEVDFIFYKVFMLLMKYLQILNNLL